jgi:hypothetical protein
MAPLNRPAPPCASSACRGRQDFPQPARLDRHAGRQAPGQRLLQLEKAIAEQSTDAIPALFAALESEYQLVLRDADAWLQRNAPRPADPSPSFTICEPLLLLRRTAGAGNHAFLAINEWLQLLPGRANSEREAQNLRANIAFTEVLTGTYCVFDNLPGASIMVQCRKSVRTGGTAFN